MCTPVRVMRACFCVRVCVCAHVLTATWGRRVASGPGSGCEGQKRNIKTQRATGVDGDVALQASGDADV